MQELVTGFKYIHICFGFCARDIIHGNIPPKDKYLNVGEIEAALLCISRLQFTSPLPRGQQGGHFPANVAHTIAHYANVYLFPGIIKFTVKKGLKNARKRRRN